MTYVINISLGHIIALVVNCYIAYVATNAVLLADGLSYKGPARGPGHTAWVMTVTLIVLALIASLIFGLGSVGISAVVGAVIGFLVVIFSNLTHR
jgi:hypothetical protein